MSLEAQGRYISSLIEPDPPAQAPQQQGGDDADLLIDTLPPLELAVSQPEPKTQPLLDQHMPGSSWDVGLSAATHLELPSRQSLVSICNART